MRSCQLCGAAMTLGDPIGREATCESCQRDLRCCRQCRHYDTAYHNSCRETEADIVEDKERRNFCEYFSFSENAFRPASPRRPPNRPTARRTPARSSTRCSASPIPTTDRRVPGFPHAVVHKRWEKSWLRARPSGPAESRKPP
jgi:hypothetical protein